MKKRMLKGVSAFLAFMLVLCTYSPVQSHAEETSSQGTSIVELYTDKAAYGPDDLAQVTIGVKNESDVTATETVALSIHHLENEVYETEVSVDVPAGSTEETTVSVTCPQDDFTGYTVKAGLGNGSVKSTAIDVSSDFTRYPRYGYSVDFPEGESSGNSEAVVEELARDYHINVVQYYDWMWRHEKDIPAPTADTWVDMFGNTIAKSSITQRIDAGHYVNQRAMAYQMAYMAREGYEDYGVKKEWGLYRNKEYNTNYDPNDISTISQIDQLNFPLEGNPPTILNVFNPENEDWQQFMAGQYTDSINTLGFDGIHVDQMGSFWGDIDYFDYYGNYVDLGKTFSGFIDAEKNLLAENDAQRNYITMNMVNGGTPANDPFSSWDITKNANTDFQFSELWEHSQTYNDLKNFVDWQRANDGGKTMVLAAYMNQYDNYGPSYQAEDGILTGVTTGTASSGITYVAGFDEAGDSVALTVDAPEDGTYSLVFSYANGTDSRATKNIYVDNQKQLAANFDVTRSGMIPASPSWDSYSSEAAFTAPKTLYLTKGSHTITIQHDSDNTGDIRLDSLTFGTFDDNSVRLTNAAIAASGAMHIEMGTGLTMANDTESYSDAVMLGHPYYPKAFKSMRDDLRNAMKAHYNFITGYENLLYDADVTPSDCGLQNISIVSEEVTGSGEPGKIWFIPKTKGDEYGILHLINLSSETDTAWRNPTGDPGIKENLSVKYYLPDYKTISGVYWASPDYNNGLTDTLAYNVSRDNTGKYVSFTVPALDYWDMIYFKWGNDATPEIIEAEDSILSGVSVNTNHSGYTGRGFVDGYGDLYDSVTFDVDIPEDGLYTLKFRYANDTDAECSRELIVDNSSKGKVTFLDGDNWDTWYDAEKGIDLDAGMHRLVLLVTEQYGGFINLDHLTVELLTESTRSLYLNNWKNTNYIWKDTQVNPVQPLLFDGPGIYEMRYYDETENGNYNTNQIKNYSMFFRDESAGKVYTTGSKFSSVGYFGDDGVLRSEYKTYDGAAMSPKIARSYAVLPNENFMIVRYEVTNDTAAAKEVSILDMLHVNNTKSSQKISGTYDSATKTVKYDMSASGQYYIAHGTLESGIDGFQIANDADSSLSSQTCSPWVTYNNDGTLKGNTSVNAADLSSGFVKKLSLQAGETKEAYFYVAICGSNTDLNQAVSTIRSQTPAQWLGEMDLDYSAWLGQGKQTALADEELNTAYNRILVMMKQSIVPGQYTKDGKTVEKFASLPATTNPAAYSYKIWARDSAVTAMSLDASGHTDEAGRYWRWLADRQIKTDLGDWKKPGTFWTCYWIWDNSPVSFVEPEYDSLGMFLVGVYRHYTNLSDSEQAQFLNDIWDSYKLSADVVMNNIQTTGFGAADCSIWEEQFEYNTFTQGLYVAGLDAAQEMAKAKGLQDLADSYNGVAGTIRSAIQRSSADTPAGLYNQEDPEANWWYYNRAVNLDGTSRITVDSSSDVLMTYGVVDMMSKRGYSHYRKISNTINHDEYGISRYQGDTFYTGKNSWDPGGPEALEDEPSWPQMTMWVAMMELNSGYNSLVENGYRRLQWYVDRTAEGYMPAGECVSNITCKPIISTSCEPITGAAYIMTALAYDEQFDMRNLPSQHNAGANSSITVHGGCMDSSNPYDTSADWQQWNDIPYYQDITGDVVGSDATRDIAKVYLANDGQNLYLRIDNVGRALPGYQIADDLFSITVYSEDFAHTSTGISDTSVNGTELGRDMSYAFTRSSDGGSYNKLSTQNGSWSTEKTISDVIAPQWETNSGRIEMVIPLAELSSSGTAGNGDWANVIVVLGTNTGTGWSDCDMMNLHYRVTASDQAWIFGNLEL